MRRAECFALIAVTYACLGEKASVGTYVNRFINAVVPYLDDGRAEYPAAVFEATLLLLKKLSYTWSGAQRYTARFGGNTQAQLGSGMICKYCGYDQFRLTKKGNYRCKKCDEKYN